MSFCDKAREEALNVTQRRCCRDAQFCGFVCGFVRKRAAGVRGTIRNTHIAQYFENECRKKYGQAPRKEGSYTYVLDEGLSANILKLCENCLNAPEIKLDDCCKVAFLRGVFLACGRMTDPDKAYALEFEIKDEKLLNVTEKLLDELGYGPKLVKRGTSYILYYKLSEQIEDILNILDMTFASLEIMNVQMEKQVRNDINRRNNFDIANTEKMTDASFYQTRMVQSIMDSGRFSLMPPELKSLALLRLNNPTSTLTELGEMTDPPIGKSAVKRRFERIAEYCEKEPVK